MRIVVVCTGNLCRSPMAAAALRRELSRRGTTNVEVSSMGVWGVSGAPPTTEAITVCRERGLDISDHRGRSLEPHELAAADLVLVMEPFHEELVVEACPSVASRVALFGAWPRRPERLEDVIPDPIGRPLQYYRGIFRAIENHAIRIATNLAQGAMCQPPST